MQPAHPDGGRARFTPQNGPWIDVSAPGLDVLSTYLTGTVDLNLADGASTKETFAGWAR